MLINVEKRNKVMSIIEINSFFCESNILPRNLTMLYISCVPQNPIKKFFVARTQRFFICRSLSSVKFLANLHVLLTWFIIYQGSYNNRN